MNLDPDAIALLYETYAPVLLRYVARRTLKPEVAVDLVAEPFAKAVAYRDQFRGGSDEEAVAWLFGIARRELSAYFRRGVVDRRAISALGLEVPTLTEVDRERVERLAGAPTAPASGETQGALDQCRSQLAQPAGAPPSGIPSGGWQPGITDTRGPFTAMVLQSASASATCLSGPSFTSTAVAGQRHRQLGAGGGCLRSEHAAVRGHPAVGAA